MPPRSAASQRAETPRRAATHTRCDRLRATTKARRLSNSWVNRTDVPRSRSTSQMSVFRPRLAAPRSVADPGRSRPTQDRSVRCANPRQLAPRSIDPRELPFSASVTGAIDDRPARRYRQRHNRGCRFGGDVVRQPHGYPRTVSAPVPTRCANSVACST